MNSQKHRKETSLEKALETALTAHRGQVDRAGNPYILHVLRVMLRCTSERARVVALLHDVVEDSEITLDDLRKVPEFDAGIIYAVDCLTRRDNESYTDYVLRCKKCTLSRTVKISDLDDHLDNYSSRVIPDEHLIRYRKAYTVLTSEEPQK